MWNFHLISSLDTVGKMKYAKVFGTKKLEETLKNIQMRNGKL